MSRPTLQHRISTYTASKTVVLVTSGATGTGPEIVKQLATSKSSYQVLLGCIDTNQGEEIAASLGAPINVNPIQLDITSDVSIEASFKTIEQHFGKLDILINNTEANAGEVRGEQDLRRTYETMFNVNVISVGVFVEKMTPLLQKSRSPKIIFSSSQLGSVTNAVKSTTGPVPSPDFAASKAALNMLAIYYTQKLSQQFKVNVVDSTQSGEVAGDFGTQRIIQLAQDDSSGVTGTFSNAGGPVPW